MAEEKKQLHSEEPVPDDSNIPIASPEGHSKRRAKKAILIVLTVMIILGGASWYLLYGNPKVLDKTIDAVQDEIIGMYGSTQSYIYYPVDYDLDITTVKEYMDRDRSINYTNGSETIALDDDNIDGFGNDVKFFVMYFYYAINGDYGTYNTLFTDEYYKDNEPYYSFTSQMIYDINIEKLTENTKNGITSYGYNVSYKIYRNNGTFRNDIGSDGSKTLYFELVEQENKVLINRISYYVS